MYAANVHRARFNLQHLGSLQRATRYYAHAGASTFHFSLETELLCSKKCKMVEFCEVPVSCKGTYSPVCVSLKDTEDTALIAAR